MPRARGLSVDDAVSLPVIRWLVLKWLRAYLANNTMQLTRATAMLIELSKIPGHSLSNPEVADLLQKIRTSGRHDRVNWKIVMSYVMRIAVLTEGVISQSSARPRYDSYKGGFEVGLSGTGTGRDDQACSVRERGGSN